MNTISLPSEHNNVFVVRKHNKASTFSQLKNTTSSLNPIPQQSSLFLKKAFI